MVFLALEGDSLLRVYFFSLYRQILSRQNKKLLVQPSAIELSSGFGNTEKQIAAEGFPKLKALGFFLTPIQRKEIVQHILLFLSMIVSSGH